MATFTLDPEEMEEGKYYDIADRPDAPTGVAVEVTERTRTGRWNAVRLLEDRYQNGRLVLPKGIRFYLDPETNWVARPRRPAGKLAARYTRADLFAHPVPLGSATIGEEYTLVPPDVRRQPSRAMFATLVEVDKGPAIMQLPNWRVKVRLDREFQEAWGLDSPYLEWTTRPDDIQLYEVPEARRVARTLARMNRQANLPPELLAVIQKSIRPDAKPGAYPGKERQQAHWRTEHERQSEEAVAAMKAGRRKTRRRQTRRRK